MGIQFSDQSDTIGMYVIKFKPHVFKFTLSRYNLISHQYFNENDNKAEAFLLSQL